MAPVIHCSAGNISLFHRTTFFPRKDIHLTKYNAPGKYARLTSYYERLLLPQTSLGPFQIYRTACGSRESRIHIIGAVGTDITVEEPNPVVSGEDADGTFESSAKSVETSETAPSNPAVTTIARSKRPRSVRKSEMPPVKDEELVPGASFTGKVRSIQPFGAFVDFGAYTEGLVHVSRMSDSYVRDVGSIVSIAQEVKVRIVEANKESGRISLTMRDSDDASKIQQRKEAPAGGDSDKPRTVRKNASRPNQKREAVQKSSKFVKGQVLDGTVKNLMRSGAFVSLPDGEEGFLPVSEESEGFDSLLGNSSLQVGQEVNVRVLRIARGKVTLTMKKEDAEGLNMQLNQGVVHMATNPFEMAFRKNKDIAAFLEEQERMQKASEKLSMSKTSEQVEDKVTEPPTKSGALEVDSTEASINENLISVPSASGVVLEVEKFISEELHKETSEQVEENVTESAIKSDTLDVDGSKASGDENLITVSSASGVMLEDDKITPEETSDQVEEKVSESITKSDDVEVNGSKASIDENLISVSSASDVVLKNEKIISEELYEETSSVDPISTELDNNEEPASSSAQNADAVIGILTEDDESSKTLTGSSLESVLDEINVPDDVKDSSVAVENVEQVNSSKSLTSEESGSYVNGSSSNLAADKASITNEEEVEGKNIKAVEENEKLPVPETLVTDEVAIADEVKGTVGATIMEEANSENLSAEITGFSSERTNLDTQLSGESDILPSESVVSEEVANSKLDGSLVQDEAMTESPLLVENEMISSNSKDVKVNDLEVSNEQTGIPDQGSTIKAMVSPALVKQLREETGAGMMDCKKALTESGGDIVKAQEFLRKKGLASADKKASRATAEGRVGSYIHDNRIGVLIEVNCETDFVSRGEIFKQLVDDLAMQVAACPQVRYLATEDVPEEFVNKEREIEMQKEDLLTKPEQIRSKIVDGRIRKRLEEFALLEQPYIKNDKVAVKDLVKQTIATIGENIKVNRFVRYNLGEGLEKKSQDFAAEVAAQTAAKSSPAAPKDQSAETKETIEKAPKVSVSAALVKQLREETGAGMMDCKKALSETGGDLEKAQEYLRMKGLSSADKKSSRLAAEGRISSYIHDSRIGALIEVNSETDFVARNEKFKELVEDLAMQVVACPQVEFVSMEDIPESLVNKEKEIEMQREDLKSKPDHIREKIVEGRISKRLGELTLLEQPFIKDDSMMVKDLVKQTVAALGENIKVRRFVRFTLGESKD